MDPEQIYQEVLSEEQKKGSSPPVAEGRAKAARQRAIEGSPHPKEPKWWPGAQPHFEGDGAPAAEAEQEAAAEAPAEEAAPAEAETAPPAERVAAEAATQTEAQAPEQREIAQGAAPVAVTESPAAAATAETEQPAEAPAAAAAPAPAAAATATQLPPEQRPTGVTHGTTTGTRLRPEDAVATDYQFDAQRAMYERRKLIDELVATGVPTVTAADTGRARAPMLALLYLLIPILAVVFLVSQDEGSESAAHGGGTEATAPQNGGDGTTSTVTAAGSAFDTDTITLPADQETTIEFVNNDDGVPHNIAIYEDDSASEEGQLFIGEETNGGTVSYDIPALAAGEYYFQCDFHAASMNGTVVVE